MLSKFQSFSGRILRPSFQGKIVKFRTVLDLTCHKLKRCFVDVVDVVLSYPDKPFILDFGPLNSRTNLYAFSWKEIGPLLNKVSSEVEVFQTVGMLMF